MLIDWNDAFDNASYVPGSAAYATLWAQSAADFVQNSSVLGSSELNIRYGEGRRHLVDLFQPSGPAKGLVVFVHGGYWHKFDKSLWSHLAHGALAHDWAVAIPGYTLAPHASITAMVQEIGAAIEKVAELVDGPIRLCGHSAGGHLVARMLCKDSPLSKPVLSRIVTAVPISGLYDLRPLCVTAMNGLLRMTDTEAWEQSPVNHECCDGIELTLWVGCDERPEFLRQTRLLAERWIAGNANINTCFEPGKHHFNVIEGLADPQSSLVEALLSDP